MPLNLESGKLEVPKHLTDVYDLVKAQSREFLATSPEVHPTAFKSPSFQRLYDRALSEVDAMDRALMVFLVFGFCTGLHYANKLIVPEFWESSSQSTDRQIDQERTETNAP